jgi:hypothetical protein
MTLAWIVTGPSMLATAPATASGPVASFERRTLCTILTDAPLASIAPPLRAEFDASFE